MSIQRFFLSALVFLSALIASVMHAVAADPPVYKIAAILPLSGDVANLGTYVKRGIDLAYEALPREVREKIQLTYEDDQFDPAKTITSYRRLVAMAGVDAVFVLGSPSANALGPLLERDKKILIAIGASDPQIAIGKTYSFLHWVAPSVLGERLATELIRRDYRRIALVGAEVSGVIAVMNEVVGALKQRNAFERVVFHATFPKSETDYRVTVQQLRQRKVDATVILLLPGALSSFARQYRSAGVPSDLVGIETIEDYHEVKAAQGALEGVWYVNAADAAGWFTEKYRSMFGELPGWGSANGYDTLSLVAAAIAHAGTTSDQVRGYLRSVKDYAGAAGTYSASGDNRFTLPAALKQVKQGKFVKLD